MLRLGCLWKWKCTSLTYLPGFGTWKSHDRHNRIDMVAFFEKGESQASRVSKGLMRILKL